ncbi:hypothetical protein Anae109_1819 [Anaeromyxobacter sp. Fw109-5]|nr:hypothetical protein Anae109_1819 [Anaeromyxobacter sp. Fw109-5]
MSAAGSPCAGTAVDPSVDATRAGSISFFTIPKPFAGHIGVIQRNALESWRRVAPGAEIFVCGDEAGAREAAHSVGARMLPDVERNEYGTPLLGSTFRRVATEATGELLVFLNADILLVPDFVEAIGRVDTRPFLLVSRRWNLDVRDPIDFGAPDWAERLRARALLEGELYRRDAIDVFVFPRESPLVELPPFAVGRPGWDNFFLYRARKLGIALVDASGAVTLVHQNHGYGHVKAATGDRWEGPEARTNRSLMGGSERFFDIGDATHVLSPGGLGRARGLRRTLRRLETLHLSVPGLAPVGKLGFALRGLPPLARRIGARLGMGARRT